MVQRLKVLGGSHAQRDVFVQTLTVFARDAGDFATMSKLVEIRRERHIPDRLDYAMSAIPTALVA
jgi:hypothetical protein